jgi:hypothetical protein
MLRDRRCGALLLSAMALALGASAFLPSVATAKTGAERGSPASHAFAAATLRRTVAAEYLKLTSEIVHGYASSSERYYSEGVWHNGDPTCWYCNVGPAVGAAYLAETEPAMFAVAVDSFNRAIAEYRLPNGSFMGESPPIQSAAFGVLLGMAYVRLAPELDPATLALWQESLAGIANYLNADRALTWYANGNINASYAAAVYFAWRATGDQKYLEEYNAELQFMVAPPGNLWLGFGLVITQPPTQADGSDGMGFLTEGSPPGWDPEYSHLQLDWLSALYSASDDPRVQRLLNLILNQELTRVNTSTFILNATGGTRKNEMMAFTSAALPLLVIDHNRPELEPLLPAAFARLSSEYYATLHYTEHNFYRGVALWLAPILLASSRERPVVPPGSGTPLVGGATPAPGEAPSGAASALAAPASRLPAGSSVPSLPPAAHASAPIPHVPPRVLAATRLQQVQALEIPGLEYAFATSSALDEGVVAAQNGTPLAFAAVACTQTCTISIRPLLVIHQSGEQTPVIVQTNLRASRVTLHAGQVLVSRVLVPRLALQDARHGHSTFVRLRLTALAHGSALQGRSAFFRVITR